MLKLNEIYLGDHLDLIQDIEDNSIDLTITSPPYGKLRNYDGYEFDFEVLASKLYRITKNGGVIVWVVNDNVVKGSKTGVCFKQVLHFKSLGFNLHDYMIWEKPNYAPLYPSIKGYDLNFDFMFIVSKGQPKCWNPIKDKPKKKSTILRSRYKTSYIKVDGSRNPKDSTYNSLDKCKRTAIWNISNGQKRGLNHPATFSENLVRDHILTWSEVGDIVFDPMVGSGTPCKVARDLNRKYIGIDVSLRYVEASKNRLRI